MKFNMSEAWNEAMAMFRANREVLLIVAGIFFFLPSLAVSMVVPAMNEQMMSDPEQMAGQMAVVWADWGWLFAIMVLAQIVGYLALLALLRDHARPTVGQALRAGLAGLLPAIGTYLIVILGLSLIGGVVLGAAAASSSRAVLGLSGVLGFVLFIYIAVKLSLAGPVIALEKIGNPFTVLKRSWRLTKGNSLRLFAFYVLLFICYMVLSIVIGVPASALSLMVGDTAGLFIAGVVSGAIGAVVTTIFVAVLAAVHRQLAGPSVAAVGETFE